jgi:prepilin-type N-terminal cleavage/methylation domain-containing protein
MTFGTQIASRSRKSLLRVVGNAGFTFAEIIVSVSVLGLLSAGSIWGLAQANNYASVARLYTGAETVAQNRIDEILSESPFNPQKTPEEVPDVLKLGTHAAETVQVYNEPNPVGGTPRIVNGQLVTTVSAVNAPGFPNLNMYAATVVVTYTFRGKNYRVQFNAMRASDI